jgi:hypothetical protein
VTLGTCARAVLLTAFTAASIVETALVSLQTWRGVPSHFNVEPALDAWVTRALAGARAPRDISSESMPGTFLFRFEIRWPAA